MKNPLKKRTDAFAKFLARKKKYEASARKVGEELGKANMEMERLAKKFQWWGTLP